jgi:hypothetical protein
LSGVKIKLMRTLLIRVLAVLACGKVRSSRWQREMTRFAAGFVSGLLVAILGLCINGCNNRTASAYALPIAVGSSSGDVRRILGAPDQAYKNPLDDRLTHEWYYSHGIEATFERDHVAAISVVPDVAGYRGFIEYSGSIVRGVRLTLRCSWHPGR